MSLNASVLNRINAHTTDPDIRAELAEMLGLTRNGIPQDDDTRHYGLAVLNGEGHQKLSDPSTLPITLKPKTSTAPESLRNLPPAKPIERPRKPAPRNPPPRPALSPHGTEAAAKRHVMLREPICDVCAAGRLARRKPIVNRATAKCATEAGYVRHLREKTVICQPCREAHRVYKRASAARTRARRETEVVVRRQECGTTRGYDAHRRHKEPQCDACREAERLRAQARRARAKAAT